jgi:hypothetical protein
MNSPDIKGTGTYDDFYIHKNHHMYQFLLYQDLMVDLMLSERRTEGAEKRSYILGQQFGFLSIDCIAGEA